jgi:hypothetical protein
VRNALDLEMMDPVVQCRLIFDFERDRVKALVVNRLGGIESQLERRPETGYVEDDAVELFVRIVVIQVPKALRAQHANVEVD